MKRIQAQAPGGSVRTTYAAIRRGYDRTLQVQGVAVLHEVWVLDDGAGSVYVPVPERAGDEWAETEQEFPTWSLLDDDAPDKWGAPRFRAQCAAELWVLQRAWLEVADEMGWTL